MDWSKYTFSLRHIVLDETPAIYFVELLARTVFLYLFALLLTRFLGKRELGQLSPYEFVVLIAMGSALGDPMFYPDVPLLPPMAVLATLVLLQRIVSRLTWQHVAVESFIEGSSAGLVYDGVVEYEQLEHERISFPELAMMLREKGIENLGDVRRAFLEPSGKLSVFPFETVGERIGLPLDALVPGSHFERLRAGGTATSSATYACTGCGHQRQYSAAERVVPCTRCAYEEFVASITSRSSSKTDLATTNLNEQRSTA
jgi:uncharacterized membrane protein YcaP (DUF421 family)